jgi:plastocyanin
MKKWIALLTLALALGLVAGCGDDDDEDSGGGGGDTAAQTETQPDATDAGGGSESESTGSEEISIGDNFFDPEAVTVPVGTTVTWTNDGQSPHTVTEENSFDSGSIDPGGEFEQVFDEAGEFEYVCTIHAGQSGKVTVE